MIQIMSRKTYSEQFRRQAVELYESTPGATFRGIAADLGITRNTLKDWVARGRTSTTGATTSTTASTTPATGTVSRRTGGARPGSAAAELAALRARVAELEAEKTLLATERDILRQAPKYFAGETRW